MSEGISDLPHSQMCADLFEEHGRVEDNPDKFPMPMPPHTPIICDNREPNELIDKLMKIVPVRVAQLEDGDYIIGDWYFSRKTAPDFISSMDSGHLSDEISRLLERYEKSALIIEWNEMKHVLPNKMLARMKSAQTMHFVIPVIYTSGIDDTVEKLVYYRQKIIEGKLGIMKRKPVIIGHANAVMTMYATLPGVGSDIAANIYAKYKTPWDFFNAVFYTAIYDKKRWPTMAQWRKERWSEGIAGIGDEKFEKISAFVLDGDVIQ